MKPDNNKNAKSSETVFSNCASCDLAEPILDGAMKRKGDRNDPLLRPGNTNCGGCGMSVVLNWLSLAAGCDTRVQMVIPACCGIVTPGRFPNSAYGAPVVAATFASAASVGLTGSGTRKAIRTNGTSSWSPDHRRSCFAWGARPSTSPRTSTIMPPRRVACSNGAVFS